MERFEFVPRGPDGSPRPPDLPQPRWVRVVYVAPGEPQHYVCAGESILGWYVHYLAGHTSPCLLPLGKCLCEQEGWLPMWKGYIEARPWRESRPVLLELTEHAWRSCPGLKEQDGHLRGAILKCWRAGKEKRAAALCMLTQTRWDKPLGEPLDVVRVLSHLWGITYPRLLELQDAAVHYQPRGWKGLEGGQHEQQ